MRRTTQPVRPAVSIIEPLIPTIRRVGAQLSAGQASYMQRVLPTHPSAQPEFYARLCNHDNARDLPRIARWVKPDVVSAAGCRIDEHLEQWPTQASSEPVIPDRPEVAPAATSTDTSH